MKRSWIKSSGVYGIQCTATGKWYVGASVNVHERIRTHFSEMKKFGALYEPCHTYGIQSMKAQVIEYIDDLSLLQDAEAYWVEKLDSWRNGYNQQSSRRNINWKNDDV